MDNQYKIEPEYVYVSIPAEYVCIYHRILAMMSDFGEEMLKDCKASCTEKNSGAIECFNMFNAAVAARHLGETKKAELIINYIKAKINQIYRNVDNSESIGFVFPVDENGKLKAFVSCNDRPQFWVEDEHLFKEDRNLGYKEQYTIQDENGENISIYPFDFTCKAEIIDKIIHPDITFTINGFPVKDETILNNIIVEYYVNGKYVSDLTTYEVDSELSCNLRIFAYYKGAINNHTYIIGSYEITD